MKYLRILLWSFIIINSVVLLMYLYLLVSNDLSSVPVVAKQIQTERDNLFMAILEKYSSEDVPYHNILIYDAEWQPESIKAFCIKYNTRWALRIPRYACSTCIDKMLLTYDDYFQNNKDLIIVVDIENRRKANAFVKKYHLDSAIVFFTTQEMSSISSEQGTQLYFLKINKDLKTDNLFFVTDSFDKIATRFFEKINGQNFK